MTENVSIRAATPGDADAIVRCIDAAYSVYQGKIDDLPDVSAGVAEQINGGDVWVAEAGSKIAGCMFLAFSETFAQLVNLAVDPDFSGKGIGKRLITHAEALSRQKHMKELRLSTHVEMPGNIGLYAHLGWIETSRSGNKVHMTKQLQ